MKENFYKVKGGGKKWYKLPPEPNKVMTVKMVEAGYGRKSCKKIKKKRTKNRGWMVFHSVAFR